MSRQIVEKSLFTCFASMSSLYCDSCFAYFNETTIDEHQLCIWHKTLTSARTTCGGCLYLHLTERWETSLTAFFDPKARTNARSMQSWVTERTKFESVTVVVFNLIVKQFKSMVISQFRLYCCRLYHCRLFHCLCLCINWVLYD